MRLVAGVPAPAVAGIVERHCRTRFSRSSRYMREYPSEAASNPGDCGVSSSCPVSAPPMIRARRRSAALLSPNSSIMTSKVHSSPRSFHATACIEGRGVELLCDSLNLGWHNKQKHCRGIKEAADQPRTGAARYLEPRPRYPYRAAQCVRCGHFAGAHERLAVIAPCLRATFKRLSLVYLHVAAMLQRPD